MNRFLHARHRGIESFQSGSATWGLVVSSAAVRSELVYWVVESCQGCGDGLSPAAEEGAWVGACGSSWRDWGLPLGDGVGYQQAD